MTLSRSPSMYLSRECSADLFPMGQTMVVPDLGYGFDRHHDLNRAVVDTNTRTVTVLVYCISTPVTYSVGIARPITQQTTVSSFSLPRIFYHCWGLIRIPCKAIIALPIMILGTTTPGGYR